MIVSFKKDANIGEFESLLSDAQVHLTKDAKNNSGYYLTRKGTKFEKDVCDSLKLVSRGTSFDGTIELVSGRSFPDIIANKYFGVEVKTSSKGSPWKCVGNSILESSRIDTVERIYMFFGKMIPPPEFKYRKYQDCLYDIAVTHSPRYMVDFETPDGGTIFDKINISYDILRKQKNPIKSFLDYYKNTHGKDCDLWWLDTGEDYFTSELVIKFWSKLNKERKETLRCQMLALFPEIVREGKAGDKKYNHAAAWLIKTHNIINTSFRDIFTGGRLTSLDIDGVTYRNVPLFFKKHLQGMSIPHSLDTHNWRVWHKPAVFFLLAPSQDC